MQSLQTRHWLEIWLTGTQVRSLDELTADDRAYACRVYCTECSPLSGKLRHADTFDLDRPEAEPIFAAAAALQDARRANDERAILRRLAEIGAIAERVVMAAAMEKCTDILYQQREARAALPEYTAEEARRDAIADARDDDSLGGRAA